MVYKRLNLREAKVSPSFPSDNFDCGYWDVKRFDSSLVVKPQGCAAQYHLFTGCTESSFSNAKQNVWVDNKKGRKDHHANGRNVGRANDL